MESKNLNKIISLSIFFILALSVVSATEIPYEGLTLNYKGTFNSTISNFPELDTFDNLDFLNSYLEQEGEIIKVKTFGDGGEEIIDYLNITSKNIVNGSNSLNWINTKNLNVGNQINISGNIYTIKDISNKIKIPSFSEEFETILLSYAGEGEKTQGEFNEMTRNNQFKQIWFHKKTGLRLKHISESDLVISSVISGYYKNLATINLYLTDTNLDNDGDTITDLEEILIYETNPLSKDTDKDGIEDQKEIEMNLDPNNENTDGDWWIDGKDSNPLSKVVPLIYYITGLILIGGLAGGFFWFKSHNRKKK